MMLALPADHFIGNADAYLKTIQTGIENLEGATGVVFGITPTRAETGYGYILAEKPAACAGCVACSSFHRKAGRPDGRALYGIRELFLEQRNVSLEQPDPACALPKYICRRPTRVCASCGRC